MQQSLERSNKQVQNQRNSDHSQSQFDQVCNNNSHQSKYNEVRKFFQQQEIKFLKEKIQQLESNDMDKLKSLSEIFNTLEQELEILLNSEDNGTLDSLKFISKISSIFQNKISQKIIQIIETWLEDRISWIQIRKLIDDYDLDQLLEIQGITAIIIKIILNKRLINQYDFYNDLLFLFITQQINKEINQPENNIVENILEILELKAINFILYGRKDLDLENFVNLKSKSIIFLFEFPIITSFFIARYFDRWLSTISEKQMSDSNDEINSFTIIRDQSKLGELNLMLNEYAKAISFLKIKYSSRENDKFRLIKMVKASAFINNFEQEAGNAFTLLSNLEATLLYQNFSNVQIRNSSINNCQFFFCNFNNSKMNNVSIVSTKFIECKIQNARWTNLESSQLSRLSGQYGIFSEHNSILITFHIGYQISFCNLLTGKLLKSIIKQEWPFKYCLKLSCKGQVLVFNDSRKKIFWSVQLKKLIRNIDTEYHGPYNILSSDCQILANSSEDGKSINLWKIYKNASILKIQAHQKGQMKFSKDSQFLISHQLHQFWKVTNGEKYNIVENQDSSLSYKFSPNGKHIAVFENKSLYLREITNQMQVQKMAKQFDTIRKLKFSPDGNILACQIFGSIFLWNIKHQEYFQISNFLNVQQMNFSPDGETFALYHKDKIVLWRYGLGKYFHILRGQMYGKTKFSKNGQHMISYSQNEPLFLWNFKNLQKYLNLQQTQADDISYSTVQFSPSNDQISYIHGNSIQIVNLKDFKIHQEFNFELKEKIILVLSPNFEQVLFCSENNYIEKRKLKNKEIITHKTFEQTIEFINFSPNGQYLVVGQSERTNKSKWGIIRYLKVWRIPDWEEIICCTEEIEFPSFKFSYNCQFIAIGLQNLIIRRIKNKEVIAEFLDRNFAYRTFAFSLNDQYLAYVDQNTTIVIYRIDEAKIIQRLNHMKTINQIVFLNDEMDIVSTSYDAIKIWNAKTGQKIQQLDTYESCIVNLTVSPNGSMIALQDVLGVLQLWSKYKKKKFIKEKLEENHEKQFQVMQSDELTHDLIEQKEQFALYKILDFPLFRAKKCSIEDSQLLSSEGFNLKGIFVQEEINKLIEQ